MASLQLSEFRTESLALADAELDDFITQARLDAQINRSIRSLWDLMVDASPETHQTKDESLVTVAGTETVSLTGLSPALYQLLGVDVKTGDRWRPAYELDFAKRNDFQDVPWNDRTRVEYLFEDEELRLFPTPSAVYSVRVWYVPVVTALSADTDTFDGRGFEEWAIADVAQWVRIKDEGETKEIIEKKSEIAARIARTAKKRKRTGPMRTRDVRGRARRNHHDRWDG